MPPELTVEILTDMLFGILAIYTFITFDTPQILLLTKLEEMTKKPNSVELSLNQQNN